jgi:hypothetical protein
MGVLADSLKYASAYSVKRDKPDLWADLTDRVEGALLPVQLDELEAELDARPLDMPFGWRLEIDALIEAKRVALAEEDVSQIMRDRFDF